MLSILSIFTYSQYRENKTLIKKNQTLSELYNAEQRNVETLKDTISRQNDAIDKFKSDSLTFEKRVDELNAEVNRLNSEPPVYIYMNKPEEEGTATKGTATDTEKIEKKDTTNDEAMKWLLKKSSSLSR